MSRWEKLALLVLVAVGLVVRILVIEQRPFDLDEVGDLNKAWSMNHGLLPWRDFRNYHLLGFVFLMQPFFAGETRDPTWLIDLRYLWQFTAVLSVWLIWRLGNRVQGRGAGVWSALFLLSFFPFVAKGSELRVEGAMLAALLGALALFDAALQSEGKKRGALLAAAGFISGYAIVMKQTMLLPAVAIPAGLLWLEGAAPERRRALLRDLGLFSAGAALPLLAFAAWLVQQGLFGLAWQQAFAGSRAIFSSRGWFQDRTWALYWMVPLLLGTAFATPLRRDGAVARALVLLAGLLVFYLGLKAPALYDQNFILPGALIALWAGGAAAELMSRLPWRLGLAILLPFGFAVPLSLAVADARHNPPYPDLETQLLVARYMLSTTDPEDPIYDGDTLYVQRPSGSFFYQHDDDQTDSFIESPALDSVLGADRIGRLTGDLKSRQVPLVHIDNSARVLWNASPALRAFIREHFIHVQAPVRHGFSSVPEAQHPFPEFGWFWRAGAELTLTPGETRRVWLNAPGRYELQTTPRAGLDIDGTARKPGAFNLEAGWRELRLLGGGDSVEVRLVHVR